MKDRTNQRGQALVYTGVISLVLFSVAALAVDVGRHVFVRREAQAVADATALAGATALARGGDAVAAATQFAPQDTVDGQDASLNPSDVRVGRWDNSTSTFTPGGSPSNAVRTTPSFTIHNIFGLWSSTSVTQRVATAAFQGAPQLPLVLCGTVAGATKDWSAGVTLQLSSSNNDTAAWAQYDAGSSATSVDSSVVRQYLPPGCGGQGLIPSPQIVGQRVPIMNGVGVLNEVCKAVQAGTCALVGKTYLFPVVDAGCYDSGALNGVRSITGFVSTQITGVDCTNVPNSISGRVVDSCATAPSPATCPSAALVE